MLRIILGLLKRHPVVDLSHVDPRFLRKSYSGEDWSGHNLAHFVPVGCYFENCNFANIDFGRVCFGGGIEDSVYTNCCFDRSTIVAASPGNARFISCTFLNADIREFRAQRVSMVNCKFSGVIRTAFFNGAVPEDEAAWLKRKINRFEGNDFSEAKLLDVAFRTGIDLSLQKLPDGWPDEA